MVSSSRRLLPSAVRLATREARTNRPNAGPGVASSEPHHLALAAVKPGKARRQVALVLLLILCASAAMTSSADAAAPRISQPTAHLLTSRPAIGTCDDPDRPCYTAVQMHTYFVHRTHRFYHLSAKFRFPASFIHQAQAAHAAWCQHHPARCKAQRAQWRLQARTHPHSGCGAGWWCHERGLISCAGGGLEPYWSCAGAYHDDTRQELDRKLSTTDKILIVGGDTMLCFLLPPGAPIVLGTGIVQMFNVWITES